MTRDLPEGRALLLEAAARVRSARSVKVTAGLAQMTHVTADLHQGSIALGRVMRPDGYEFEYLIGPDVYFVRMDAASWERSDLSRLEAQDRADPWINMPRFASLVPDGESILPGGGSTLEDCAFVIERIEGPLQEERPGALDGSQVIAIKSAKTTIWIGADDHRPLRMEELRQNCQKLYL